MQLAAAGQGVNNLREAYSQPLWGTQALLALMSRGENQMILDVRPDRNVLLFTLAASVLTGSSARSVCIVRSFVFWGFALHEGRLLFITAPRCKAAGLAFSGAMRIALAEEADGSGTGV
ncbi:MAG: hypothetical protein DMG76_02590 [Acidobacteria bacterium]|nr:MAG: hypothetical protein DMG76_02590 [Acidobacteriota bacterium]